MFLGATVTVSTDSVVEALLILEFKESSSSSSSSSSGSSSSGSSSSSISNNTMCPQEQQFDMTRQFTEAVLLAKGTGMMCYNAMLQVAATVPQQLKHHVTAVSSSKGVLNE